MASNRRHLLIHFLGKYMVGARQDTPDTWQMCLFILNFFLINEQGKYAKFTFTHEKALAPSKLVPTLQK
jgi:hypothetical protein